MTTFIVGMLVGTICGLGIAALMRTGEFEEDEQ
jgi:hypothetical protein